VHTRGLRDNYLWSTELASMVSEKRRLWRVWQLSRSRSDKTIYNRACKDLSRMLLDLKSKSLEAYLADLEPCSADHKLWNATKYLKRPTRRIAPVRSLTGAWCRSNQKKANAFADHLRSSFQPFDLCDPEDLQETLHFLDVACPMDLPIPEIDCEKIKDLTSLKPTKAPVAVLLGFFLENCGFDFDETFRQGA